ncbi:sulfhydryl oxidase 2-like [Neocloeon triangulifer]|uniref:sulfhydryl oxidase 2-like n=1 Tax=Neocloeon triangulifer TaxID=2078957 RepID=UPI00286F073D|nr:sulfhydryl oxidase 2-like [Neocloeon triangulifer]
MRAVVILSVLLAAHAAKLAGNNNEPTQLYTVNDKVELLTNLTFRSAVYEKPNVWLVEFYNSWCGFCQRFAPTWKEVAASVYPWKEIVTVGVVDCAKFENNPLCRDLEIMSYPTMRVFPPMTKPGEMGIDLEAEKTFTSIKAGLLEFIEKEQLEGKGVQGWPTLTPYRNSEVANIWAQTPSSVQHIFLIFEEVGSTMGKEVILDFHKVKNVQIRRATTNNEALAKLIEVSNYPALAVLKRDMSVVHVLPTSKTREGFAAAVHAFLAREGIIEDVSAVRDIPRETDLLKGKVAAPIKTNSEKVHSFPDVVYQADLENTLRFSLKHEIAMHRVIAGETLEALKMYLRSLASFYPTRPQGTMFLERLRDWVEASGDSIRGEDFMLRINQFEKEFNFIIPENQDWIGCRGSDQKFRGYTCGLWTMFHALTVSAASQTKRRATPGSELVLQSILRYVRHFFGCAGCSKHFQEMARNRNLEGVRGLDEAVMWLWEAHNVVNKRLKGDVTEDPHHPKIQFPNVLSCSSCKVEGEEWDREQVLRYVKERYAKNNICNQDADSAHMCAPVAENVVALRQLDQRTNFFDDENAQQGSSEFNYADIFLCVVLYLVSAVVLVLGYYKFIYRRGYKMKYNVN